jgi:1,4-dihydroxy-2-naphthoate octaprenyltransferase
MNFQDFIEPELFILVPVLYVLGMMIKKSSFNDRWIPLILGGMGIILSAVYMISAHFPLKFAELLGIIYASVTQGILCASGSVYADNVIKQFKKGSGKEDINEGVDKDDRENDNNLR